MLSATPANVHRPTQRRGQRNFTLQHSNLPPQRPGRRIQGVPPSLQPRHQFSPGQRESAVWKALALHNDMSKRAS